MEDVPKLADEHLEKAKEIISGHRTKKNCSRCYGRGYQGVNQLNMAILCYKCVDEDKVTAEWQAYVRDTPALAEVYGDYFESEEDEDAAEGDDKHEKVPESVRNTAKDSAQKRGGGGGPQMHRPTGR